MQCAWVNAFTTFIMHINRPINNYAGVSFFWISFRFNTMLHGFYNYFSLICPVSITCQRLFCPFSITYQRLYLRGDIKSKKSAYP